MPPEPSRVVAPPLEWHPAYEDRPWLMDWLNGQGPSGRHPVIKLSMMRGLEWGHMDRHRSSSLSGTRLLRRQQCWALAPYVGREFVYIWSVAVDELGRAIAGEAGIQYLRPEEAPDAHPVRGAERGTEGSRGPLRRLSSRV
jgi:hypothetical protein